MVRLTQEEFTERSTVAHGGFYDYSLSIYKTSKEKVKIICPVHGVFEQIPSAHSSGHGCVKCRIENHKLKPETKKRKLNSFIKKADLVHGNKYDYSKTFLVSGSNVIITCKQHGDFEQNAGNHIRGRGCIKCFNDNRRVSAEKEFFKKAKIVHADKNYDYSLVEYKNTDIPIKIICPQHGIFEVTPYRHLNGQICQECAGPKYREIVKRTHETRLTVNEFIKKSISSHDKLYDYSLVRYNNNHAKVKIICKKHGVFKQNPSNHMKGVGCPSCAEKGFNVSKSGMLYYLKIKSDRFAYSLYKIGITNRSVEKRYSDLDLEKIKVLKIWDYRIGKGALEMEQKIIKLYKSSAYKGTAPLDSVGVAEIFVDDVLHLDLEVL
jgi:hypothetical protein